MARYRKAIAYAYPTSPRAAELGVSKAGGWYVEGSTLREDGTWTTPYVWPGTQGDVFDAPDHPDLINPYFEIKAEACWMFLRHGDARALLAIKVREQNRWLANEGG
jgi:hypothetical protein